MHSTVSVVNDGQGGECRGPTIMTTYRNCSAGAVSLSGTIENPAARTANAWKSPSMAFCNQ